MRAFAPLLLALACVGPPRIDSFSLSLGHLAARPISRVLAPESVERMARNLPLAVLPALARRARQRAVPTIASAETDGKGIASTVLESADDFGEFDWKKHWYPVAFDAFTDKSKPFAFTLLGERLVIWWDHVDMAWSAMLDVCPHRLAPLSEGRVNAQGDIECPYHGWSFDGESGACTAIPQSTSPEAVSRDKRACGTAMHTALEQGIIWVWGEPIKAGEQPPSPELLPVCPAFALEGVISDDVSVDLPYDYTLLLENVMDISHVPYTHHGTQGKREFARPINYTVTEALTQTGFKLESRMQAPIRAASADKDAAQSDVGKGEKRDADIKKKGLPPQETVFRAPCYQHTEISLGKFTVWVVTYAVPTVPGQCRLLARFPVAGLPKIAGTSLLLLAKGPVLPPGSTGAIFIS